VIHRDAAFKPQLKRLGIFAEIMQQAREGGHAAAVELRAA